MPLIPSSVILYMQKNLFFEDNDTLNAKITHIRELSFKKEEKSDKNISDIDMKMKRQVKIRLNKKEKNRHMPGLLYLQTKRIKKINP